MAEVTTTTTTTVPATAPVRETGFIPALKSLLHSRRFLILIGVVIYSTLVYFFPDLAMLKDNLEYIIVIAITVVGGYTITDAAEAFKKERPNVPNDLKSQVDATVQEAIQAFLNEVFPQSQPAPVAPAPAVPSTTVVETTVKTEPVVSPLTKAEG